MEPLEPGEGFEFVNKIVGGVVPKEYIPAVEAGVKEAMQNGVLAGYPVVDVRGDHRGRLATTRWTPRRWPSRSPASMGFREGARKAEPVLLEPIMKVEVITPEEYMGDVMGDLNAGGAASRAWSSGPTPR